MGASGDLAPLAHMALPLIGEGHVLRDGEVVPSAQALQEAGLEPLVLGPKEGLALLNGTQVSTALALAGLFEIERVFAAALVTGALSVDAARGSDGPFDPRIQALRRHRGQQDVAATLRGLLGRQRHPRVAPGRRRAGAGPLLPALPAAGDGRLPRRHAPRGRVLATEANGVSDNPLVFASPGEVVSGGNFHAEPVGFAADHGPRGGEIGSSRSGGSPC